MPHMAESVVVDLSRQGRDMFCVDDEPFPWWVSEEGPFARKLADDLYLVHVEIICTTVTPGDGRPEQFYHEDLGTGFWPQPVLLGVEFPWWISEDGFTYRSSGHHLPTVELEFFAKSVEGIPILGEAAQGKIRESGGNIVAKVASA
jgi:hypothetical protein